MFKKEILVNYTWSSKKYGSGNGYYIRDWYGKLKGDDINILIESAQYTLKKQCEDEQEYFKIIISNIVYLK